MLDYLFIGACSLGPIGAALGTTLAQTLSVIVSLIAIKVKKTGIHVSANALKPQREVMGEILKVEFRLQYRTVVFRLRSL